MIESGRGQINRATLVLIAAAAGGLGAGAMYWAQSKGTSAPILAAVVAPEPKEAAPLEIRIPAEYLAAADISVEAVAAGGVDAEILAPATVAALPGGEATVVARASGTIARVNRRLGDAVKAGEVLALVDSLDAAAMSADRSVALAKAALARKSYEREKSLSDQGVTPRQDMETAQAAVEVADAEARRASSVAQAARIAADGRSVAVVSPIAGKLTAQAAMLGAFVQPQAELFRVAASGAIQVEASVTAGDARRIAAGDKATIVTATGARVQAIVHSVTPTVSGLARSATVVLTPNAHIPALVIGEGAQVRLYVKGGSGGLTVPEDAVQNIEGRDVLFVRTQQGFRPQPVLVGIRSGGTAQIVSGVKAGDQVATRNAFLIKADMIKSTGGKS